MLIFILQRMVQLVITLWGVVTLTFLLVRLTPGDPVDILLGDFAMPAQREVLQKALGLHVPPLEQYVLFLQQVMRGDLGVSFYGQQPVAQLLAERLPATLLLGGCAFVFAVLWAVLWGTLAAWYHRGWADRLGRLQAVLAFAVPSFVLGPLLLIAFAFRWPLFPLGGMGSVMHLVLPSLTLGFAMAMFTARLTRNSLLEALNSHMVITAQAKGWQRADIFMRHVWPNALLPIITVLFLQMGALLTGAIITETVFSWPGIGSLLVDSLHRKDYPMVQGSILLIAFVYCLMTLLADVCNALADPRVRRQETGA